MTFDTTAEYRWYNIKHGIVHDAYMHLKENPEMTEDEIFDASHQYADGHENVIYTYRSRMVWANCDEVQDQEENADVLFDPKANIDQRITLCVYLAYEAEFAARLTDFITQRTMDNKPSDIDLANVAYLDGTK